MIRQSPVFIMLVGGWLLPPLVVAAGPWPAADRWAGVDPQGVMRWQDTGQEVALFGVNYYTPFWHNYPDLKEIGASHKQVIDQDVLHFARMGLDALRLHVFDREVSDEEGNLLENEHLDLLDYLIAHAKQRGIYTVLTPIAWWAVPGDSPGFSTRWTMHQMTTDPAAWKPQVAYLRQFVSHVNPYTGLAYKDDPAVVCLELINEPQYPPDTSDEQVVEYINALAAAVRDTGCRKPIFYNGWGNRLSAVNRAHVDGSSFGWYPSGLVAGHSLRRNFLPAVNVYGGSGVWNPSMRTEVIAHKAKIIYEFDAADIPGSYMYPAMARAFRSGGAQIATQFQYDPLPLARFNQGWQTHFLNLVCAPQKAVSFAIAAAAFHKLPRLEDYGPYPQSSRFGPCRVSYEEDLSELVTPQEFFYSNSTSTRPPSPGTIQRVIGCGSSPLVVYGGTGAYFLEQLMPGVWRLELYPDAVWVNDPYGPHRLTRDVARILWRPWPMTVHLEDLGDTFGVRAIDDGNDYATTATAGQFTIRPGVYLLNRADVATDEWKNAQLAVAVGLREFVALPEATTSWTVRHEPLSRSIAGRDLQLTFTVVGDSQPDRVELVVTPARAGSTRRIGVPCDRSYQYRAVLPGDSLTAGEVAYALEVHTGDAVRRFPQTSPDQTQDDAWRITILPSDSPAVIFDAARNRVKPGGSQPCVQRIVEGAEPGHEAVQISVSRFEPPPSAVSFRHDVDEELDPWREALADRTTLRLRARAREQSTTLVEVVLLERDGAAWGTNVPLSTQWQEVRVPLSSLRYFSHWAGVPEGRGGANDRLHPENIAAVSVCFGAWLYPNHVAEPHTIEIESIGVE
jgi:hypothetical protein